MSTMGAIAVDVSVIGGGGVGTTTAGATGEGTGDGGVRQVEQPAEVFDVTLAQGFGVRDGQA